MTKTKRLGAEISELSLPFSVRATQRIITDYSVNIWDSLENLTDVEEAIFVLGMAEEHDTVTINLNCDGGSLYVGTAILQGMRTCRAPVHVVASGRVASFATFILLNADSFEIDPYTEILCHSAAFGSAGKMTDTLQHTQFTYAQCKKLLHSEYEVFLTEDEINHIIDSKYEHYMDVEEFITRYERRNEFLQSKLQDEVEEFDPEYDADYS